MARSNLPRNVKRCLIRLRHLPVTGERYDGGMGRRNTRPCQETLEPRF
jgi:hypothetical protein